MTEMPLVVSLLSDGYPDPTLPRYGTDCLPVCCAMASVHPTLPRYGTDCARLPEQRCKPGRSKRNVVFGVNQHTIALELKVNGGVKRRLIKNDLYGESVFSTPCPTRGNQRILGDAEKVIESVGE